jgi:hypothetical protein
MTLHRSHLNFLIYEENFVSFFQCKETSSQSSLVDYYWNQLGNRLGKLEGYSNLPPPSHPPKKTHTSPFI